MKRNIVLAASLALAIATTCIAGSKEGANLSDPSGLRIREIQSGSIYEKLGLKNGDVLVELDGKPVKDPDVFLKSATEMKPGRPVELKVKRKGKLQVFTYTLKEAADK